MARINTQGAPVDLENPTLIEGFPGVGLVGKIATDHLVDQLEMRYYASVHCEGLPRIGVYRGGDRTVRPPVRLYVSEEHNLLALQSDAPIGAQAAGSVANCVTNWIVDQDATPLYLSGLPAEREDGDPSVYGVATGNAGSLLEDHAVDKPPEDGVITGPTGALINRGAQLGYDTLGLVVECNPQFPDPEAAGILLEEAIAPISGLEIDVDELLERAEEIRAKREQFAQQMQALAQDESSQAQPLRMYQ
ncbi:proteasome assembly chaperone family protein [Natronolimnobius sp. AArcel1]|uniref:proteasome assembly chaperone family protein n=1 Tax=Natronolimnobius sp. AArcel1 TaxID=1679093 RepID=UPI0013EBE16D|nr:proteasome assembly chaperone family protein [Natronolimnobius sp. AArcel1]NGM69527.1 proteasome assembly chaperone family protein [Natronolimnobius sp. AArcel1]